MATDTAGSFCLFLGNCVDGLPTFTRVSVLPLPARTGVAPPAMAFATSTSGTIPTVSARRRILAPPCSRSRGDYSQPATGSRRLVGGRGGRHSPPSATGFHVLRNADPPEAATVGGGEHRGPVRVQAQIVHRGVRQVRPETRPRCVGSTDGAGDESAGFRGAPELAPAEHERVARNVRQKRRDVGPRSAPVGG